MSCTSSSKSGRNGASAKNLLNTTNLPTLTGTEKQIAYANDIRNEYINRINNDNVDNTASFPNTAFVVDSFMVKETKSLLNYMIGKKDENGKSIIRQVFPEKWRREVSAINSAIHDTSVSDDTNAVSNLKNLMKPVIEFNLSSNTDSKYWIDNYKHLLYKK